MKKKKCQRKNGISLIEHKSDIDYNTIMQVLCYIFFIWEDYEKEMVKKDELSMLLMMDEQFFFYIW